MYKNTPLHFIIEKYKKPLRLTMTAILFGAPLLLGWGTATLAAAPSFRFTVTMDEPVNIDTTGGTPSIPIDVGGQTRAAVYTAGSGSSSLTFTYTATPGDLDLDGITVSSPLVKNGATITDLSGNPIANADLAFTPPVTTGVKINYPSLSMDFINDRYSYNGNVYNSFTAFRTASGASFTNNANGTYFDSTGILRKTSAANTPRMDHDPVTHAAKGLLIEESSQNIMTRSENVAFWYVNYNNLITRTPNATAGPRGSNTMTQLSRSTTSTSYIGEDLTGLAATGTYTFSIFAKKGDFDYLAIRVQSVYPSRVDANFNLAAGTYTTNITDFTNVSASITPVGNDVYRCSVTFTSNGSLTAVYLSPVNSSSAQMDWNLSGGTAGSAYIDGAQLEHGSYATSYIPTSGSAVTRTADSFIIPATGGWYDQSKGSVYADQSYVTNTNETAWPNMWRFDDGGINNRWNLTYVKHATLLNFDGWKAGTPIGTSNKSAPIASSVKFAAAQIAGNTRVSYDGALNSALTSWDPPPVTRVTFSVGSPMSKWTKTFRYYPQRVGDTQLPLLTQ